MENKKLMKAKVGIILSNPFFATLMMRRQFVEDESIKTTATDGKLIKFNPAYLEELSQDELMGVICHDLLHTTLLHHTRREGRDIKQWNKATDYAINPILVNSNLVLPKGYLIDNQFDDMSAEQIFKLLPAEQEKQDGDDEQGDGSNDGSGQGDMGCGGIEDAPGNSESETTQTEAEAKLELAQALQIAKQQGKLPAGMARLAEEVLKPRIAWQEVLARFLAEVAKNDYSFSKPNMRYLHTGFILPSLYNVEIGQIVLVVDTSGSIDEVLLNEMAAEMQDICSTFNVSIKVYYVDAKLQGEQDIEPDDVFKLTPKGGGGTDFRPAFVHMEEQGIEPKALVYFTDLACHSFPNEPSFPVLWAKYGNYKKEVPFGEVVQVD